MRSVPRRLVAVVSATALSASLVLIATGQPAEAAPVPATNATTKKADRTSAIEKRRSKSVKTPKLTWHSCYGYAKCATVKVPLDYDKPRGTKIAVAVLKVPAKNKKKRIGSLFINPGGPGASGTEMARSATSYLSTRLTDRFDVVGFDPRGIAHSKNVRCFPSVQQNDKNLKAIRSLQFPYLATQEKMLTTASNKQAKACSTTGKPLTGAVSTAEVARDMDLLRRAVGDKKLSYFGFSYGSYLGEVYANLYPDRVRAIAIDGVIDPVKWAGTKKTQSTPMWLRLQSAQGASKALRRALVLCDRAGETKCAFAAGNPVTNFDKIAQRLRKAPLLVEVDPETHERAVVTYDYFIRVMSTFLYLQDGGPDAALLYASLVWDALSKPTDGAAAKARRQKRIGAMTKLQQAIENRQQAASSWSAGSRYDNGKDAYASIICTDSRNSKNLAAYPKLAGRADKQAPYFGRLWLWGTAACSSKKWTVKDEDAYRGPFTKRTSSPLLIVGNYWDPATNYASAVATSKRMPNSRLLSSNSWGHTAYGTSTCTTNAVDAYLVSKRLPAKGKVCVGDDVPFTEDLEDDPMGVKAANALKTKTPIAFPPISPGLR